MVCRLRRSAFSDQLVMLPWPLDRVEEVRTAFAHLTASPMVFFTSQTPRSDMPARKAGTRLGSWARGMRSGQANLSLFLHLCVSVRLASVYVKARGQPSVLLSGATHLGLVSFSFGDRVSHSSGAYGVGRAGCPASPGALPVSASPVLRFQLLRGFLGRTWFLALCSRPLTEGPTSQPEESLSTAVSDTAL